MPLGQAEGHWLCRLNFLQLYLFPQVRRRLNELLFGVPGAAAFFVLQEHHTDAYITGGDDGGLRQRK